MIYAKNARNKHYNGLIIVEGCNDTLWNNLIDKSNLIFDLFLLLSQLNLPALSTDASRDELHDMQLRGGDSSSGGAASPLTARSIRLERVAQALAHSQEELRRYVFLRFYYLPYLRFGLPETNPLQLLECRRSMGLPPSQGPNNLRLNFVSFLIVEKKFVWCRIHVKCISL